MKKKKQGFHINPSGFFTWLMGNKWILVLWIGCTIALAQAYQSHQKYKTLKVAYQNQEKKLKATEKKLKNVKVNKNVVKVIEKTIMSDGTIKETSTITDLTITDVNSSTSTTSDLSTRVVLPALGYSVGIGLGYQVLGYGTAQDYERLSVYGMLPVMDQLDFGVRFQKNPDLKLDIWTIWKF